MIVKLIALALLAGIAELDRTSIFHGLLSEPIVLSPLAGYILGDPILGFKIGIILQLFFVGCVSMGGSTPPDGAMATIAAVISASMSASYVSISSEVAVPVVVLVVMYPAAMIGSAIDMWRKESNVALLNDAEERLDNCGVGVVEKAIWVSIGKNFIFYTLAAVIVAAAGTLVTGLVLYILPAGWWKGMKITGDLLLLASAGIALASLRENRSIWIYLLVGICLWILMISVR
jgi:mannose/fructose/N-acetylgalactosamine-specific phosphotransferase system component IIC